MKNILLSTTTGLLTLGAALGQTSITLVSEDFETGGGSLNSGNNNMNLTIGPNPAGSGSVGIGDTSPVNAQWGTINTIPRRITLPSSVAPGVSTYTMSVKVYIPSDTTFADGDRMGVVVRWNNNTQGTVQTFYRDVADFPKDTWETLSLTEMIPALDADGANVTLGIPSIVFQDSNDDAIAGVSAYIDDYLFEASVSADDPNLPLPPETGFGEVEQNGGATVQTITLNNTGVANTLTISDATLDGVNADLFTLAALSLPFDILPGESATLQISLDPGAELGPLSAMLNLTTNDQSTPMISTMLAGNSEAPFVGRELLSNGDFEAEDLESWRANNGDFDLSDSIVRSGSSAASFMMRVGRMWGDFKQNSTAVDGGELGSIAITPDMYGKAYFYSAWYYRPSVGGPQEDDTFATVFRLNSKNQPGNITTATTPFGTLPVDTWVRITTQGTIPATEPDGVTPLTEITGVWNFRDLNTDATEPGTMYIDDISFKVDVPPVSTGMDPIIITDLLIDEASNDVSFSYPANIGANYAVDRSSTLQPNDWTEIEATTADEALETFTDTGAAAGNPRYFYRVRLVQ